MPVCDNLVFLMAAKGESAVPRTETPSGLQCNSIALFYKRTSALAMGLTTVVVVVVVVVVIIVFSGRSYATKTYIRLFIQFLDKIFTNLVFNLLYNARTKLFYLEKRTLLT